MIRLEKVNEKTFKKVVDMRLSPEQNRFVAPNVVSLAQAWLYYENAMPLAILDDNIVVGFIMLDWDENERNVGIWRFMIDPQYQGKGYGHQALSKVIEMAKDNVNIDMMNLDYIPGNDIARNLYASFGFKENGEIEDGEVVMTLLLTDNPKIGLVTSDEDDLEEIQELIKEANDNGINFNNKLSIDKLPEIIDKGLVTRVTIFSETIGLGYEKEIIMFQGYESYYQEAFQKYHK